MSKYLILFLAALISSCNGGVGLNDVFIKADKNPGSVVCFDIEVGHKSILGKRFCVYQKIL